MEILIVPVGLEYDRVISSIKHVPVNKIYLLRDEEMQNADKHGKDVDLHNFTSKFADRAYKELNTIYNEHVLERKVNLTENDNVINVLGDIILSELKSDSLTHIHINISTATKLFGIIACHLAAFYPKNVFPFYLTATHYIITKIIKGMDFHEEFEKYGLTRGPYEIVRIPVVPHAVPNEIALNILKILDMDYPKKKPLTIKEIVDNLGLFYEKQKDRQKISHWLRQLNESSFIDMEREGIGYRITINDAGDLFFKLLKSIRKI